MNIVMSKIAFVIFIVFVVIFSLWLSIRLFFILLPFLIAYLLSKPLIKLTEWLNKRIPLPYSFITMIVVLIFVSVLSMGTSFLLYKIALSLRGFSAYTNTVVDMIQSFAKDFDGYAIALPWLEEPVVVGDFLIEFYDLLFQSISSLTTRIVEILFSILKTLPIIAFFFFFMFISLYFFIKDHVLVNNTLSAIRNKIKTPFLMVLMEKTGATLKSYIKAQLILVSITFTISIIALTILKIPFSPLVAFGISFIDLIPMIGPAFVYVPWIIFTLLISEYSTGIGLFVAYLVTTLTRQIIEPKIVSSKIGTHPLITIISMYGCYRFFGVIGFIYGALLVMSIIIGLNVYREVKQKHEH